jgi:ABC-type Fe3+-hydroxamate transport system substrate-binding protein
LVTEDPQWIVMTSPAPETPESAAKRLSGYPGWNRLQAVKNQHILWLAPHELTRPVPRIIGGIEKMAAAFGSTRP